MTRMSGFPPPPTVGALSTGMTKKHSLKNVIPRPPIVVEGMLDRGIQGFFNLNTKDTLFLNADYIAMFHT